MKGQFFKDGAIYGAATILSGISNVLLVSIYTRAIEQSVYGAVEYLLVFQVLIQAVVGLELTQGIARFYGGADTDADRRAYASTGFWSLVAAYGLVCAVLFLAADQVEAALFGGAIESGILRPAVVSLYLWVMFYVVRSQLRWELRAATYALASLIAAVSVVSISAYLLLVLHLGVTGVFVGSAAGYGLGVLTCLYGLRGTYAWSFDVDKLKHMLRFSLPLTVSTLALFAASYGDRVIIRAAMGFDDLGVYAAGARLASIIAMASAGFQLGAAPIIYRHYQRPETPETLAQLLRLFLGAGLVGVLAFTGVSIEMMAVFAAPGYAEAWRVVPLLALATVLASGYIFLPGLSLNNMTARFAAISVTTAVLTLIFIAVLAPAYGIVGTALGALGGAGAGFCLHAIFNQRVYALPVSWLRIIVAIVIVVGAIALTAVIGGEGPGSLLGRILLSVVSAHAIIMVLLTPGDRTLVAQLLSAPRRAIGRFAP